MKVDGKGGGAAAGAVKKNFGGEEEKSKVKDGNGRLINSPKIMG
jgi:hypothetical protein